METKQHGRPRRWLILSHGFNMDGRAASLTVTDKIAHLQAAGIEPVVLSAVTGTQDQRFEHHRLLPWGPSGLRFDLRHLLAMHVGRGVAYKLLMAVASLLLAPWMVLERLTIGLRSQWSWALAAFVRGAWRLRRGDIELVYSSGGAYSAHLAGWWLKRWCGARWIVEVHDPLVFPGRTPRTRDERFQAKLEGLICAHADVAWWFTAGALESARRRHPALGERGIVVIPGAEPPLREARYARSAHFVLGHFGSLSPTRSLAPLLRGIERLFARRPAARDVLRVEVYGSDLDPQAASLRETGGLQDVVIPVGRLEFDPVTGLSGRERVHVRMQQVDALVLLHGEGPDCSEYIPSKLYDYFWARRPVLALTRDNEQLDAMVRAHGGWIALSGDDEQLAALLEALLDRWQRDTLADVATQPVGVDQAVTTIVAAVG
jgi:hypothetical protein